MDTVVHLLAVFDKTCINASFGNSYNRGSLLTKILKEKTKSRKYIVESTNSTVSSTKSLMITFTVRVKFLFYNYNQITICLYMTDNRGSLAHQYVRKDELSSERNEMVGNP